MSLRQQGRKAVFVSLLCAAGVVVLAGAFWEELVAHFYCRRLQKDPGLMVAMVKADQRALDRIALDIVLKTRAVRTALLGRLISSSVA